MNCELVPPSAAYRPGLVRSVPSTSSGDDPPGVSAGTDAADGLPTVATWFVTAKKASTTPPVTVRPDSDGSGLTVALTSPVSCAAVRPGESPATRATVPETYGVAIDVPV